MQGLVLEDKAFGFYPEKQQESLEILKQQLDLAGFVFQKSQFDGCAENGLKISYNQFTFLNLPVNHRYSEVKYKLFVVT